MSIANAKNHPTPAESCPDKIPPPIFPVGRAKVRWKPMPTSDWGTVMGMRYIWAQHLASWQWQYYIVLDPESPSYSWSQSDWGWHDDLELLPRWEAGGEERAGEAGEALRSPCAPPAPSALFREEVDQP